MARSTRELVEDVPQVGRLTWIGVRSARRGPVESVPSVRAVAGLGLEGDHRAVRREPDPAAKRQVTLIQGEHLPVVAAIAGTDVAPADLRRNLVIEGVNLASVHGRRFSIGTVVLEATGPCHPCSRMEETIGPGGFQAMRGHGGITARIVTDGTLAVGDEVRLLGDAPVGNDT
ncbi:MAG: MOSC domain-containing protein [Actinobacteria bacterium]|nr:MOSC domain-containing protein [Actinomycetota bacterium]